MDKNKFSYAYHQIFQKFQILCQFEDCIPYNMMAVSFDITPQRLKSYSLVVGIYYEKKSKGPRVNPCGIPYTVM